MFEVIFECISILQSHINGILIVVSFSAVKEVPASNKNTNAIKYSKLSSKNNNIKSTNLKVNHSLVKKVSNKKTDVLESSKSTIHTIKTSEKKIVTNGIKNTTNKTLKKPSVNKCK